MFYRLDTRKTFYALIAVLLTSASAITSPTMAGPGPGSPPLPTLAVDDFDLPVQLGPAQIDIFFSTLLANDSWAGTASVTLAEGSESAPMYGSLTVAADHFTYSPDPAFWSLGIDSFAYTLSNGRDSSTATAYLYALRDDELIDAEAFESSFGLNSTTSDADNFVITHDSARVEGTNGLMAYAKRGQAYASILLNNDEGSPNDPGGARTILTCPPNQNPLGDLSVLAIGGQDPFSLSSPPSVRMVMVSTNEMRVEVYDTSLGTYRASPETLRFFGEMATVEIDWFRQGASIGAMLRVDGETTVTPLVHNPNPVFDVLHIGVLQDPGSQVETTIGFDHLEWFEQRLSGAGSISPVHFGDSFESGTVEAWKAVVGNGLWVSTNTEAEGHFHLGSQTFSTSYLFDDNPRRLSPQGDEEFTVVFRFNTFNTILTEGDGKTIYGFGANPESVTPLDLNLRAMLWGGAVGDPRLLLRFDRLGTILQTVAVPLNVGPNTIAIQYRVEDDTGGNNGYAKLWVNGSVATEMFNLSNWDLPAVWSHLGASGDFAPGLTGSLYFDNFISAGRLPLASPAP